jgi:hypothetical protein
VDLSATIDMLPEQAAAPVGAGDLSVLILPSAAVAVRKRGRASSSPAGRSYGSTVMCRYAALRTWARFVMVVVAFRSPPFG